ncbi:hypothetical protein BH23ACT10_BH23ACT10_37110 [soil metagenome]
MEDDPVGDAWHSALRWLLGEHLTPRRYATVTVLYLVAWTALDALATIFEISPGVSLWLPSVGLNMALLLVFGLRFSPLLLLNTPLHELFVQDTALGLVEAGIFGTVTTAVYVGAAVLLLRPLSIDPRLSRDRDVMLYVTVACLIGPLVVALCQVALLTVIGETQPSALLTNVLAYWAGSATGAGALGPALIVLARRWPRLWRQSDKHPDPVTLRPGERSDAAVEAMACVLAAWIAYGTRFGGPLDYVYMIYLPLIWIAVRRGFARATWAILLTNLVAALLSVSRINDEVGFTVQFGLMTFTLTSLLLATVVTQGRTRAAQLQHDANHDVLTGLPNRRLLRERITDSVNNGRARDGRLAVLIVDLDRFKAVNDSFGHAVGDDLLMAVAGRLDALRRPTSVVARLGGDEFVVVVEGFDDTDELTQTAQQLRARLQEPFELGNRTLTIDASIGIAVSDSSTDADRLIQAADTALGHAKSDGTGKLVNFTPDMRKRAITRLEMEVELRDALRRDAIEVWFQPIYTLNGQGSFSGVEALARWSTDSRGDVPPSVFVPLTEMSGMIHQLGRHVLTESCARVMSWQRDGGPEVPLSVNVSAKQLVRGGFADEVLETLADSGLAAGQLTLEITESAWVDGATTSRTQIDRLADAGVAFVIDDFGSGYSSFSYLQRLPIQGLKLDLQFVTQLPDDDDARAIAEAVVAMAQRLHLGVTAEGVENERQLDYLRGIGCQSVQGNLLGAPMPPENARTLWHGGTRADEGT